MEKALRWLTQTKLNGTYPVALRAMVLARLRGQTARKQLEQDVRWLMQAAYQDGSYTATSAEGKALAEADSFDNTHSQWAVLGVSAGADQGVSVPQKFWRRVEKHWQQQQQADGGWGFSAQLREGKWFDRPYGSETAAGVATLAICRDQLTRKKIEKGLSVPPSASLTKGLTWLEEHFSVMDNPQKNAEMYFLWLYQLQRVGNATGRKYLAGVNWHSAAATRLRKLQNPDGSWGYGPRTTQTCLALLFLARSEAPILLSKLHYPGAWNTRPRDAANATAWLTYMFERPLGWQVLDLAANANTDGKMRNGNPFPPRKDAAGMEADWQDGRVVYISSPDALKLTDEQIDQLRRFVRQGGLIFCEAINDNAAFTESVQQLAVRLFPEYPLTSLPAKHPIYTAQFPDVAPRDLQVVDNGIRPLLLLSPHDVSLALQRGPGKKQRLTFNLIGNLYLYLTEKGASDPRGWARWPEPTHGTLTQSTQKIPLARVLHEGNCDPEPAAMDRLAIELAERDLELKATPPLPWNQIEAEQYPLAYMTGTTDFVLTAEQRINLQAYLAAGGTLIADAAGGSSAFARAFRREVLAPMGTTQPLPLESKLLSQGPAPLGRFVYRQALAAHLDERDKNLSRLEVLYRNGRPAVIFSPDDIAAGLVGYPLLNLKGLSPETARKLMVHFVLQFSRAHSANE